MTLVQTILMFFLLMVGSAAAALLIREESQKHISTWVGSYIRQRVKQVCKPYAFLQQPVHILFCMVDHFEPVAAASTLEQERERMKDWLERYPLLAKHHRDSDGRPPQHTWFYPGENYRPEYLDDLTQLCRQGLGEIELHLHHGNDTSASLKAKIQKAIVDFSKHGALMTQETPPRRVYGFIHGNMALDNSMNDPALCGVNDELTILRETGCYADFSMPTAPGISQTKKINAVYYAEDDPQYPKSHNVGVDVEVRCPGGTGLMIIQGPLGLNWLSRKWGIIPKIDNAEIQGSNPPSYHRIRTWVRQHVHVKGKPEWVIVKVSCHGAEDRSRDALLGEIAHEMYSLLEAEYRDRSSYHLHYVTARELYNIIAAAEAGLNGNPHLYRNYIIPPYQTHSTAVASEADRLHSIESDLIRLS